MIVHSHYQLMQCVIKTVSSKCFALQVAAESAPPPPTEVDPVMEKKYKDNFYAAVSPTGLNLVSFPDPEYWNETRLGLTLS